MATPFVTAERIRTDDPREQTTRYRAAGSAREATVICAFDFADPAVPRVLCRREMRDEDGVTIAVVAEDGVDAHRRAVLFVRGEWP